MSPLEWFALIAIVLVMSVLGPAENATKKQHRHR